jgi:hypothetical protein
MQFRFNMLGQLPTRELRTCTSFASRSRHAAQELLDRSEVEELEERLKDARLAVASCSVTIVRYLSDAAGRLPVGILTRLLQTHDTVSAMLPLVESPPWRRERNDATEQLEASQWVAVPASERFRLSNPDAQVRNLQCSATHATLMHQQDSTGGAIPSAWASLRCSCIRITEPRAQRCSLPRRSGSH